VVVRANDFTLGDLRENRLPRQAGIDHLVYLGDLVALVVEVQDDDVRFPAVHARV
jgi:hypothetical protein